MRPPPPPDAPAGGPPPPWRSSSPAYTPHRISSSGDGGQQQQQQHQHHQHLQATFLANLPRPPSSGGLPHHLHHHRASTPQAPPPPADDPATEAAVWEALACMASAGCADPALGGVTDAVDGAGGLRVAPPVPFPSSAGGGAAAASTAPPALPHLAHPASVEAPTWLERLLVVKADDGDDGEPSTTSPLPTPAVVVGARGAWLALPPPALAAWDRGGPFRPAGGPKAVFYFALVPRGAESGAGSFLAATSAAWAAAGLGTHQPAGAAAPGASAAGIIAYDASGGLPALARAYAALHLALARARPPTRWPGIVAEEESGGEDLALLAGGAPPDGSLVVYILPPPPPTDGGDPAAAAGGAAGLRALIACARAPTAPPPPAAAPPPPLSRLARSSDCGGGVGSTATVPRLPSDTGTATTTTTTSLTRGSTPDWHRTAAARDTYRRESGTSRQGSPALGGRAASGSGSPRPGGDGGPVAVPCVLQVLPCAAPADDLAGRQARALAFCVFNKVAPTSCGGGCGGGGGCALHHQPLAALREPAGRTPALHCAFSVVPPDRGGGSGGDAAPSSTLIALAFSDGLGELAPGARVVRVAGDGGRDLPAAVLAACDGMARRMAASASRAEVRPVSTVITRLGAPPPAEAAAWEAALGGERGDCAVPTCVLALSVDPPFRPAGLGPVRPAPFVCFHPGKDTACIVWAPGAPSEQRGETVRAGVLARVAGRADLAEAASEVHALGALATAVEAAVQGAGGWVSACAHLPAHASTALRLARLVAAGR